MFIVRLKTLHWFTKACQQSFMKKLQALPFGGTAGIAFPKGSKHSARTQKVLIYGASEPIGSR